MSGDYREASAAVRRDIKHRHGAELADCDRIRELAVAMFENWTGHGIESTADGLLVAIFARSTDTFTCSIRNVRLGYGAQAAMLNRSLFEDMVDAHWIITDPETAEARYVDHDDHARMLRADDVSKFPDLYPDIGRPEFDPAERKRLDKAFGDFGQKPWSGLSLHDRFAFPMTVKERAAMFRCSRPRTSGLFSKLPQSDTMRRERQSIMGHALCNGAIALDDHRHPAGGILSPLVSTIAPSSLDEHFAQA